MTTESEYQRKIEELKASIRAFHEALDKAGVDRGCEMQSGSITTVVEYPVNDRIDLLAEERNHAVSQFEKAGVAYVEKVSQLESQIAELRSEAAEMKPIYDQLQKNLAAHKAALSEAEDALKHFAENPGTIKTYGPLSPEIKMAINVYERIRSVCG